MEQRDLVVLVDARGRDIPSRDSQISTIEKIEAHHRGLLHRAVSVFIFNDRNELLLQKRAANKYHSAEKWSNTCCTHPVPGENPLATAYRRLKEEMGLQTELTEAFTFTYRADVGSGLTENEFDHVLWGISTVNPKPDPSEVADWRWITLPKLQKELAENPQKYTPWLRLCFNKIMNYYAEIESGTKGNAIA
jgi:isopentenyl-diphosphate Delta-isomerase